ncbi:MAG: hypothetical protein VB855_11635, partial [Pirellulaceae bacterium]
MTTLEERYVTGRMYGEGQLDDYVVGATLSIIRPPTEPFSPFQTVFSFAQNADSGILGVEVPGETIALSLGRGSLIKTASNIVSDDEELLVVIRDSRQLTRTQLEPAIQQCMKSCTPLDQVLFALKLVGARDLVRLWRSVHETRLGRVLRSKEASYTFARADLLGGKLAGSAVHLDLQAALRKFLSETLENVKDESMAQLLETISGQWIEMNAAGRARAGEIGFSSRELT